MAEERTWGHETVALRPSGADPKELEASDGRPALEAEPVEPPPWPGVGRSRGRRKTIRAAKSTASTRRGAIRHRLSLMPLVMLAAIPVVVTASGAIRSDEREARVPTTVRPERVGQTNNPHSDRPRIPRRSRGERRPKSRLRQPAREEHRHTRHQKPKKGGPPAASPPPPSTYVPNVEPEAVPEVVPQPLPESPPEPESQASSTPPAVEFGM